MKRIFYVICAALLIGAQLSAQNNSYWERFPAPNGEIFNAVFQTDSGLLYAYPNQEYGWDATTPACLYRSADHGTSWTKLTLTLNGELLHSFVRVGPSGSFYALKYHANDDVLDNSLYRSTDEGATWELLAAHKKISEFYETPSGALLITGYVPFTISRSADNGQSWQAFAVSSNYLFKQMEVMPNGYLVLYSPQNSQMVYIYSKDDGQHWIVPPSAPASSNPDDFSLLMTAKGTFIRDLGTELQRSEDEGQTWDTVVVAGNKGIRLQSLTVCASGRILGISLSSGFYYSDDEGLSWTHQNTSHAVTQFAGPSEHDGNLYGYANQALYHSADEGINWQFASNRAGRADVFQMAFVSADTFFALTSNGLWRTDNNGLQWNKLTDNRRSFSFTWGSFSPRLDFKLDEMNGLWVKANDTLWWSGDLGTHMSVVPNPNPFKAYGAYQGVVDSVVFADDLSQVYRTDNKGATWQPIAGVRKLYYISRHPTGRIYAFAILNNFQNDFLYSDDRGITWLPVPGSWNGFGGSELFINQSGTIYAALSSAANGFRLYRSIDNGLTWDSRPFNLYGNFSENAAGHLFMNSTGMDYRSLDQAISWNTMPAVPGQNSVSGIVNPVSPDQYLFVNAYPDGLYRTSHPTTEGAYLDGSVRVDADADCSTPDAQTPLQNWTVEADGANTFFATTDSSGYYRMFVDTGAYAVQAQVPNALWWNSCAGVQQVQLDSLLSADTVDFPVVATSECPLMTVDMAIPLLRRCFDNTLSVNYCNQGAEQADSAWVDLTLDPFTSFVSATLPAENQGNNVYRFQVGNVPTGNCGAFNVVVHIDCDSTVLGQTHCFTAHGYPDTLCTSTPNWSGATIQASISCQDTTVDMKLKNIGTAPSQALDYIIIIDDVVLLDGNQSYAPNQEITITQPADGHTWRIESQQEPGHPFATNNHIALAFTEGCGGYNSLGYINQFPVDEFAPSYDRECVENTGAYDPNDKQGFPLGTGAEHLIRTGQDLEYLIRFQNTGTDTAFTVVVRDTLSPWLDPASVRPGAASHPYTWSLSGQGILSFTFSHILLPDSTANEAASHGFISFRIGQQPDVPLGTVIYNDADIYFDFNDPVVTNQTWNTIGKAPSVGITTAPKQPLPSEILTTPQPAGNFAVFRRADGQPFRHDRLLLTDALGRTVRHVVLNGGESRLDRAGLDAGLYFFRIESADGHPAGAGRLQFL